MPPKAILSRLQRCTAILLLAGLTACGGGGGGSNDETARDLADGPPVTTSAGTLRPSVVVVSSPSGSWAHDPASDGFVPPPGTALPAVGTILMFDDATVKVTSVGLPGNPRAVQFGLPAVEEVFAQLSLREDLDLSRAEFEPAPGQSATLEIKRAGTGAASGREPKDTRSATAQREVRINFSDGVFHGSLGFLLTGLAIVDYDEDRHAALQASLTATASIHGSVLAATGIQRNPTVPEYQIGQLRVPVPFHVVDALLKPVGIRLATLVVPLRVGGEAELGYSVGLRLGGEATSSATLAHTDERGLHTDGVSTSASLSLRGELPGMGPTAAARAHVRAGPYVRALPELQILNGVAAIGTNVKVGMYADGDLSLYLQNPFHCLFVQPRLRSEVSGFFVAAGLPTQSTATVTGQRDAGSPFVSGDCASQAAVSVTAPGSVNLDGNAFSVTARVAPAAASGTAPSPMGRLRFEFQGGQCAAVLVNGQAQCSLRPSHAGARQSLRVFYEGDDQYAAAEASALIDVTAVTPPPPVPGTDADIQILSTSCTRNGNRFQYVIEGTARSASEAVLIVNPLGGIGGGDYVCEGWNGFVRVTSFRYCLGRGDLRWTAYFETVTSAPSTANVVARIGVPPSTYVPPDLPQAAAQWYSQMRPLAATTVGPATCTAN